MQFFPDLTTLENLKTVTSRLLSCPVLCKTPSRQNVHYTKILNITWEKYIKMS